MKPWGSQVTILSAEGVVLPRMSPRPAPWGTFGAKQRPLRVVGRGRGSSGGTVSPQRHQGRTRLFKLRHAALPCHRAGLRIGIRRAAHSFGHRWATVTGRRRFTQLRADADISWERSADGSSGDADRSQGSDVRDHGPGDAVRAGPRQGVPSRSMAQQRTNSRRAMATIAGLRRVVPPLVRRFQVCSAHWLYRSMAQALCTRSLRRTAGPRLVIRPRRSDSPDWNCRGTSPA